MELPDTYADFLTRYPEDSQTTTLDSLRATEYGRLERNGQVYLDCTGGCLYGECQVRSHLELLGSKVFGNPHSANPSSAAMTDYVEQARRYVLRYFNASPEDYIVVFTQNATGALKLPCEAYPFSAGGRYALTFDNHNSVNGIREFALAKGAEVTYVPLSRPDLRIQNAALEAVLGDVDSQTSFGMD